MAVLPVCTRNTADEKLLDKYRELEESLGHFGTRSGLRPGLIAEAREIRSELEARGWHFPVELPTA